MGNPQAEAVQAPIKLPKMYPITLPSSSEKLALRKMTVRDQEIVGAQYDQTKQAQKYGNECARITAITPGSVSMENPGGVPFFTTYDSFLELDMIDFQYLTEAVLRLNRMGEHQIEYKFDF